MISVRQSAVRLHRGPGRGRIAVGDRLRDRPMALECAGDDDVEVDDVELVEHRNPRILDRAPQRRAVGGVGQGQVEGGVRAPEQAERGRLAGVTDARSAFTSRGVLRSAARAAESGSIGQARNSWIARISSRWARSWARPSAPDAGGPRMIAPPAEPRRISRYPSPSRTRSASRSVTRDTPSSSACSRSGGSFSPARTFRGGSRGGGDRRRRRTPRGPAGAREIRTPGALCHFALFGSFVYLLIHQRTSVDRRDRWSPPDIARHGHAGAAAERAGGHPPRPLRQRHRRRRRSAVQLPREADPAALVDRLDGLVVAGGEDVNRAATAPCRARPRRSSTRTATPTRAS